VPFLVKRNIRKKKIRKKQLSFGEISQLYLLGGFILLKELHPDPWGFMIQFDEQMFQMGDSATNYSGCLCIYGGLVEMIFLFTKGVTLAGEPAIHGINFFVDGFLATTFPISPAKYWENDERIDPE